MPVLKAKLPLGHRHTGKKFSEGIDRSRRFVAGGDSTYRYSAPGPCRFVHHGLLSR
jgi:hypothetical protein